LVALSSWANRQFTSTVEQLSQNEAEAECGCYTDQRSILDLILKRTQGIPSLLAGLSRGTPDSLHTVIGGVSGQFLDCVCDSSEIGTKILDLAFQILNVLLGRGSHGYLLYPLL
jgi:hypothetical protein